MIPTLDRPLSRPCLHIAVDMQRLFAEPTVRHAPALADILPRVVRLARHAPEDTVFTHFVPAERPEDAAGAWHGYCERWHSDDRREDG